MTEQEATATAEKIAGDAEIEMANARICESATESCARTHAAQVKLRSDIANALLSASPSVEVRPLEWESVAGLWGLVSQAGDRFGRVYSILRWNDGSFSWSFGGKSTPCESIDAAKLAADQHYRARIGLALRTAGGGG